MTLYEIFEPNNPQPICDGYDLTEVIVEASEFLASRMEDPGTFEENYTIVATDEDTGEEETSVYTIRFFVERGVNPVQHYGTFHHGAGGVL